MILIRPQDPRAADATALLTAHLAFANEHSAPEDVHALDVNGLCAPNIQFFGARDHGSLLGVGAIKQLDGGHYEIKSMHTARSARGRGIGRSMVEFLLAVARDAGADRVSLETGTMDAFAAARGLYTDLGFVECAPFGDYRIAAASVCMTLTV